MSLTVGCNVPAVFVGIIVETDLSVVVEAHDIIAVFVSFHQITAVLGLKHLFAGGHGIAAAPEFNAVQYDDIGQNRYLIDGKNPEGEEHKFVDKFIADILVPAEQTV